MEELEHLSRCINCAVFFLGVRERFPSVFHRNLRKPELPFLVKVQALSQDLRAHIAKKKCKKETRVGCSEKTQADKGK